MNVNSGIKEGVSEKLIVITFTMNKFRKDKVKLKLMNLMDLFSVKPTQRTTLRS